MSAAESEIVCPDCSAPDGPVWLRRMCDTCGALLRGRGVTARRTREHEHTGRTQTQEVGR